MTKIIETPTHVFEITVTPGDEVPGRVLRSARLSLLSGSPLTDDEWQRIREQCVRDLIAAGIRVRRAGCQYDSEQGAPDL